MFGGTDVDGIDEGDGDIVEIEAGSPRRKSSEIENGKEGSTSPHFNSDLGHGDSDGDSDGDGDGDGKEGSIAPHFGDIDGEEGSKTPPYESDGDDDGDGDGDGIRQSRHQPRSPNRLTYNFLADWLGSGT